jgi:hypothetical protein
MPSSRAALRAQAGYYLVTGAWPLVHYDSFERITGGKSERWLVETAGGLIATIGANLALAAREGGSRPEATALSVGSALTLGTIDLVYLVRGRLGPAYAVDLAVQAGFLALAASAGDPA